MLYRLCLLTGLAIGLTFCVPAMSLWLDNKRLRGKLAASTARESSWREVALSTGRELAKLRTKLAAARWHLDAFEDADAKAEHDKATIARVRLCEVLKVESSLRASKRRDLFRVVGGGE